MTRPMNPTNLLDSWTARLEGRANSVPDSADIPAVGTDLARTVRFLKALYFDVLREQCPSVFASLPRADGPETEESATGSQPPASAELSPAQLARSSAACGTLLSLLGLAEGFHQHRMFASSDTGFGGTFERLFRTGVPADELEQILDRIDIRLVATAHPTNIFRSIVLGARREIYFLIADLYRHGDDETSFARTVAQLRERLSTLNATRLGRWEKPGVLDEVRQVAGYFRNAICAAALELEDRLRAQFARVYGRPLRTPSRPLLRFGSWVGGDMDGNPFVNPEVYRRTVETNRAVALQLFSVELAATAPLLSHAWSPELDLAELEASLDEDMAALQASGLDSRPFAIHVHREPFRLKLELMRLKADRARAHAAGDESIARDDPFWYRTPCEALRDLEIIERALRCNGFAATGEERIRPLRTYLEMFGFHLASLDLREDSVHIGRAARLALRAAGHDVDPSLSGPADADPAQRLAYLKVLTEEILSPKSVDSRRLALDGDACAEFFADPEDFQFVRRIYGMLAAARAARRSLGDEVSTNFILTMTSSAQDVLHALLLLKSAGMFHQDMAGTWRSDLDIVPLFETIDALQSSASILETVFGNEAYRAQLKARGERQIAMLGFSDSNKDGGYFASNWSIHDAQRGLLKLGEAAGISMRFFYGRGGSIGRGGASSRHAAHSLPPGAIRGGYDLTEQGEVLSRYYVIEEIAQMHFETVLCAAIEKNAMPDTAAPDEFLTAASRISHLSQQAYRKLIHEDSRLIDYFQEATPHEVELLNIGSRPARRRAMRQITDLRAIPWVFRWLQSRQMLPGWFGLGTALASFCAESVQSRNLLHRMVEEWMFFRAILESSALALWQSDLEIASRYRDLARDRSAAASVFSIIALEHAVCRASLFDELGCDPAIFYRNDFPMLYTSRSLKDPWLRALGVMQTDLLRKYRAYVQSEPASEATAVLGDAVRFSVEGVALGLGATG